MSAAKPHPERPEVEALANFALTVPYGRPILDLCDYIRSLEEQLEVLREALTAIATGKVPPTYGGGAYSHRSLAREALGLL